MTTPWLQWCEDHSRSLAADVAVRLRAVFCSATYPVNSCRNCLPGPGEATSHGANLDPQHGRDGLIIETLEFTKNQNSPRVIIQSLHRLDHFPSLLGSFNGLSRRILGRRRESISFLAERIQRQHFLASPIVGPAAVDCDSVQPGVEVAVLPKRTDIQKSPDEGVLNDFLSRNSAPDLLQNRREQTVLVLSCQQFIGSMITADRNIHQFKIAWEADITMTA